MMCVLFVVVVADVGVVFESVHANDVGIAVVGVVAVLVFVIACCY